MVLISEEGRRFKARCQLVAQAQVATPLAGEVSMRAMVYFRDHRRDLDNVLKPLLDALQGIVYANDRQIVHLDFRKALDPRHPRIELEIAALSPPPSSPPSSERSASAGAGRGTSSRREPASR
jgi:Holliday junction resolvase RusA-like endonuclease